jgi:hypothetical protein
VLEGTQRLEKVYARCSHDTLEKALRKTSYADHTILVGVNDEVTCATVEIPKHNCGDTFNGEATCLE